MRTQMSPENESDDKSLQRLGLERNLSERNVHARLSVLDAQYHEFQFRLQSLPGELQVALLERRDLLTLRLTHVRELFLRGCQVSLDEWRREWPHVERALLKAEHVFSQLGDISRSGNGQE